MIKAGALAAFVAMVGITPAWAQVRAVVQVHVGYPVAVYAVPRPVIVRRALAPNVLIVERVPRRGKGWWKRHGYQRAIVYSDGRYYYNGWMQRPGVTQVTVYARDGRYATEIGGRSDRMERDD